jgi:hypothetical protein
VSMVTPSDVSIITGCVNVTAPADRTSMHKAAATTIEIVFVNVFMGVSLPIS